MTKNLQKQLPAPHSPFQCWKIVKFKLMSHEKCYVNIAQWVGRGKMRGEQNFPTLMAKVVVPLSEKRPQPSLLPANVVPR